MHRFNLPLGGNCRPCGDYHCETEVVVRSREDSCRLRLADYCAKGTEE